jgi:hypothetical protein
MNDDLNSGLNGNMRDFFADDGSSAKTPIMGGIGAIILHLVVIALLVYSGYHGIHASARYREAQGLGNAAGIVGILIIEFVMLGIYLAYFYRRITGEGQKYAAAATFGIGVILSAMGIVGDSLLQAGLPLPSWLSTYLTFGLPIAPVIMGIGAAGVLASEPKLNRQIRAVLKQEDAAEKRHTARMKAEDAKLQVAQSAANLQLNSLQMTAEYAHAAYRAPEVQQAIQAAALANLPELLRGAGVMLPYGTVIEGQTVEPLPPPGSAASASSNATPRPSLRDRVFGRSAPAQPASPVAAGEPSLDTVLAVVELIRTGEIKVDGLSISTPVAYSAPQGGSAGNGPAAKPLGRDAQNPTPRP